MIDTHCHLTFPDFEGRIPAVLADARAAGVTGAITVSTTTTDCVDALEIARSHDRVWCSAGVHPLYADRAPHDWAALRAVAQQPECVAWGELGLDNHYDTPVAATQHEVLADELACIERARAEDPAQCDLPIILHCRKAFADLVPILRQTSIPPERFVFHCFTGGPEDMELILDFGAFVSFTGVVTYHNAKEVQDAARMAPLDRVMVETDAPFLTPHPHRGTRPCEPKHAIVTARFLADLRAEPWDTFHDAINGNTTRFFGIE